MNGLTAAQKLRLLLAAAVMVLVAFLVAFLMKPLVEPLVGTLVGKLVRSLVGTLVGVKATGLVGVRVVGLERTKKEKNEPGLILPPGAWLRDMLHVIYSPTIAERVFDPTIADMQLEWQEAMIHDRTWLANWIQVRGVLTVLLTVLAQAVTALGSIFKLVK